MCKCTEGSPGAVGGVLDVIALCALVDLGVELLLSPGVAILARVPHVAVDGITPLVRCLDSRTGSGSILELPGASPPVLVVVILRTSVALSTESWGLLARLSFVVCQNIRCIQPLGVVVEEAALLVEAVGAHPLPLAVHEGRLLPAVIHRGPEIIGAVGEGAVGPVLDAVSPVVRVVNTHPCLVIPQVISPFSVPSSAVKQRAAEIEIAIENQVCDVLAIRCQSMRIHY